MTLFSELNRRNVLRVITAYVVSSWLIVQVAETVFPAFDVQDTAIRVLIIVLAIGLVPVAIFAWVFEITPEGLKFEKDVDQDESITSSTARKLNFSIILVLTIAVTYFAIDKFLFGPARVETVSQTARLEGRAEVLSRNASDYSIAVMPFVDLSAAGDQEYFSDGLAEELLNLLARIPELRVVSRTSSFSFKDKNATTKEIARDLNVSHILEGSVRVAGETIRVTAQLIDSGSDSHVWSKTWDRSMSDIFAIQDEIANSVANELVESIVTSPLRAEATVPEAFAAYMQARYLARNTTEESLSSAAELYRKTIEMDPEYGPAWSGLANIYINQASRNLIPRDEGYQSAKESAMTALSLDPDSASAYEKLGWIAMNYDDDLPAAARYYERALNLAPSNSGLLGNAAALAMKLGRMDEATELAAYAASREPVSAVWQYNLGVMQYYSGEFDSAVQSVRTALTLSPGYLRAQYFLSLSLLALGNYEEALDAIEQESLEQYRAIALPLIYFALQREAEAEQYLDELTREHQADFAYNIAGVHAFRGSIDLAFDWLSKAIENSDSSLWLSYYDPLLKPLHRDQRWESHIRDVDLLLGRSPEQLSRIQFTVELP